MKSTLLLGFTSLLLAACATPRLPTDIMTVGEPNKRFWFRDLRSAPSDEGVLVSGYVVRKKGGFMPIPGHLRIEALANGVVLDSLDTRWRRINWRARSSGRISASFSSVAREADLVRISYKSDEK